MILCSQRPHLTARFFFFLTTRVTARSSPLSASGATSVDVAAAAGLGSTCAAEMCGDVDGGGGGGADEALRTRSHESPTSERMASSLRRYSSADAAGLSPADPAAAAEVRLGGGEVDEEEGS